MEKDKFDDRVVAIEQKLFETGIMMSGFVMEILKFFPDMRSEIYVQIPYNDYEKGFTGINVTSIYIDSETDLIALTCENRGTPLAWDELDLTARDILLNELHHAYKSEKIYKDLSGGNEGVH